MVTSSGRSRMGTRYREPELCKLRTRIEGVPAFQLVLNMTALENAMEGQVIVLGRSKEEARDKAMHQLRRVGLEEGV